MWEQVTLILQWAFPGGLSLLNIFLVRMLWKRNKSRISKDTIETWKQIAESNNEALLNTQKLVADTNERNMHLQITVASLNGNLNRLEQMLEAIIVCSHYDSCPVRPELQHYKDINRIRKSRQPVRQRKIEGNTADDNSGSKSDIGYTPGSSDETSGESGI